MKNLINKYFHKEISEAIQKIEQNKLDSATDIRIRANKPIIIENAGKESIVVENYSPKLEHIKYSIEKLCSNSLYSYANEIKEGYITIAGGHRVGLAGSISMGNGEIKMLREISSINLRIARQVLGSADFIIKKLPYAKNILLISPPGGGKTTVLRDLIRQLSNSKYNIAVIDERGELAGSVAGRIQNDLGIRADVLEGVPKAKGMILALRSLRPDIIAVDEIALKEDYEAIEYLSSMGIKIMATIHAKSKRDLELKKDFKNILEKQIFEEMVYL